MAHHSEEDDIEFEANFSGKEEAEIRTRLIALQEKIREANVPVIVLLCGVNGSGKMRLWALCATGLISVNWICMPMNAATFKKIRSNSAVTGAILRSTAIPVFSSVHGIPIRWFPMLTEKSTTTNYTNDWTNATLLKKCWPIQTLFSASSGFTKTKANRKLSYARWTTILMKMARYAGRLEKLLHGGKL